MTETAAIDIINSAADRVERALSKPKAGGAKVVNDLLTHQQLQRVQGGLTPSEVSRRLQQADLGFMAPLVDLANSLRQKDNHLQGILETRETSIRQLKWEIVLPHKPTKKEKKAGAFLKDALSNVLGAAIAQASSAPFFGYAVSETLWRKSGAYLVPERFDPIAHRRFQYAGNRLLWNDYMNKPAVDIVAEYPGQFVISRPRVNGDVPCREGLMRPLVWAALFRNWDTTDWLRLAEIAWKPWRTGSYDREKFAKQEEIDGLVEVIDAMSSSGVAVLPDSVKLKVEWPTGSASGSPHKELFSTFGREMSKSVLGQTETTEASSSSGYGQSKVMYEVKRDKTEADAGFVGDDMSRDVAIPCLTYNFGDTVRANLFKIRLITDEMEDLQPFGVGVKALREAGLRIPAKWARDKVGIPEPAEGEEIIGEQLEAGTDGAGGQVPPAGDGKKPGDNKKSEA